MGRIAGVTPEETRNRLIEAAGRVFAERGFEGARIAEIAREAGLSSGAIYAHYGSKAELLLEAIRSHGADELNQLLEGDELLPLPDVLLALGERLERRPRADGSLLVEAVVAARRDPDLAAVLADHVGQREAFFATLVRHSQRRGDLDGDVSPEAVARLCFMIALGSLVMRALDLPRTDPDDWSALLHRIVDSFRLKEDP
ncbi:MAG TPA: TetR/AcrR family transcriptional regulator [Acidimicrobiales bacterium]